MHIPDEAIRIAAKALQLAREEIHPATLGPDITAQIVLDAAASRVAAQVLREIAEYVDVEGREVDWEETTEGAGRRHAADEIRDRADELDPR